MNVKFRNNNHLFKILQRKVFNILLVDLFYILENFRIFNFGKYLVIRCLNLRFGKLFKMLIFILLKILPVQIIF